VQALEIKDTGIYKLEVYGAQGGTYHDGIYVNSYGGAGGYSVGYVKENKDTTLFICVGAQGQYFMSQNIDSISGWSSGGYNGGGNGYATAPGSAGQVRISAGGGGATHIGTRNGTLAQYGNTSGLLIAAGGGGGNAFSGEQGYDFGGGAGGGINGGAGVTAGETQAPGTQSSGYAFGQGGSATTQNGVQSGGGGGLYGGCAGSATYGSAGNGGSGYIGGVPQFTHASTTYIPSTSNGVRGGNGYAKITLVAYL
jgi:hypothetical protein